MEDRSTIAVARVRPLSQTENQINLSTKKEPNFYVFLAKKLLQVHDTIEMHALGSAAPIGVIAAENLVRTKYAEFKSIRSETITVDSREGQGKKAKLLIILNKHQDF